MPLFWPMATTSRARRSMRVRKTFAPAPAKSHTLNRRESASAVAAAGHQVTSVGWLPHASSHASRDRKSTRLNSSHLVISYAVFCLKKKKNNKYIQLADNYRSYTFVVQDRSFFHTAAVVPICVQADDTFS